MPCTSVLSTAVAAKLNARIKELLNDGLSDSEIVRAIRREANTTHAWPEMSFARIKQFINKVMESEETSDTESVESAPTFDSDEEDEEYVPEAEDESSDEDDDEDDEEYEPEADETETDEASEEEETETKEMLSMVIYFDHNDYEDEDEEHNLDRLTITPVGDGLFEAEMAYDLPSSRASPRRANFFEGDADSMQLYIADILRLIALDDLPMKSVELAIPFFPNISFKPRTLRKKSVRSLVRSAVLQFLEHYEHNA